MEDFLNLSTPSSDLGAEGLEHLAAEFRHHERVHEAKGDAPAAKRAAEEAEKLEKLIAAIRGGDWRGF